MQPTANAQQPGVWNSALRAFDQWIEGDEAQRAQLLEQLAEADPDMHANVLRLIAADREAESAQFLHFGAMADAPSGDDDEHTIRDLGGTNLGAWRIERLLGRGGSGQVWLAQRSDGRHSAAAAIKVLRVASGDRTSRLRFAREGRLLARLRHAHIARLLDVGDTAEGERYLVLEYVDGERIDRWCDQRNLSIDARLRLFLQVCDAVAYAHANLVVHRDLKPSNILVQDDGDAKVLDWGVAKLLDDENAEGDGGEVTRLGGAPFTPEYAAPEQFANAPVTVATDVYSLAMVLYVLLTGRRPYGDDAVTPGDIARVAAADTPRRLSPRAAVNDASSERLAQQRATTPQQLQRILRGDLDTIVEKALKTNPAERYVSVQSFAEDLRRYLEGKPIHARRDRRWYVLRKFVGRHRVGVATGLAALMLLFAAAVVVVLQSQRLKSEVARATAIKNFFLDSYLSIDASHSSGEPADDAYTMLKGALKRIDKLAVDPQTRAETHETVANIFAHMGRFDDAQENYRKAAEIYTRLHGVRSKEALMVEASAINSESMHGNIAQLMPRIDDLLANVNAQADEGLRAIRMDTLRAKIVAAIALGDVGSARAAAEQRYAEAKTMRGGGGQEYSDSLWLLALVALEEGLPREAEQHMLEVLAQSGGNTARLLPRTVTHLRTALAVLNDYGNYRGGALIVDRLLAVSERDFGKHGATANIYYMRALLAANLDKVEDAERDFASALAIAAGGSAPHSQDFARFRYAYGVFLLSHARIDEASKQFAACKHDFDELPDSRHWRRAACATALAYCTAFNANDRIRAIADFDAQIAEQRARKMRELPMALWLRARLATEHLTADPPSQQLAWLDEAIATLDRGGRGGSRLAHDVEAARRSLGAAPFELHPQAGDKLLSRAIDIANGASSDSKPVVARDSH